MQKLFNFFGFNVLLFSRTHCRVVNFSSPETAFAPSTGPYHAAPTDTPLASDTTVIGGYSGQTLTQVANLGTQTWAGAQPLPSSSASAPVQPSTLTLNAATLNPPSANVPTFIRVDHLVLTGANYLVGGGGSGVIFIALKGYPVTGKITYSVAGGVGTIPVTGASPGTIGSAGTFRWYKVQSGGLLDSTSRGPASEI